MYLSKVILQDVLLIMGSRQPSINLTLSSHNMIMMKQRPFSSMNFLRWYDSHVLRSSSLTLYKTEHSTVSNFISPFF